MWVSFLVSYGNAFESKFFVFGLQFEFRFPFLLSLSACIRRCEGERPFQSNINERINRGKGNEN